MQHSIYKSHILPIKKCEGVVIQADLQVAANDKLYALAKASLEQVIWVVAAGICSKYMTEEAHKRDAELEALGMIHWGGRPVSKALVKLSWALPQAEGNLLELKRIMERNYVGELNHYPKRLL